MVSFWGSSISFSFNVAVSPPKIADDQGQLEVGSTEHFQRPELTREAYHFSCYWTQRWNIY